VTVAEEDEIEAAIRFLATQAGIVAEGAAAAAVAAVRAGRVEGGEQPIVVVVSGRNIAAPRLAGLLGSAEEAVKEVGVCPGRLRPFGVWR
jgi:threonine dehydratase